LRCVPAFSLYASLIRDQKAAAGAARGPSGRLPPDWPGSGLRLFDAAIPVARRSEFDEG
jgi:hypothetical protein